MTTESEPLKPYSREWYRHYYSKAVIDREDARRSFKAAEQEGRDPVEVNWLRARYDASRNECAAWEKKVAELDGE